MLGTDADWVHEHVGVNEAMSTSYFFAILLGSSNDFHTTALGHIHSIGLSCGSALRSVDCCPLSNRPVVAP